MPVTFLGVPRCPDRFILQSPAVDSSYPTPIRFVDGTAAIPTVARSRCYHIYLYLLVVGHGHPLGPVPVLPVTLPLLLLPVYLCRLFWAFRSLRSLVWIWMIV